jgi:hypothetical protein
MGVKAQLSPVFSPIRQQAWRESRKRTSFYLLMASQLMDKQG